MVKHLLLAEGHLGEAIDRCAREHDAETVLLVKDGENRREPKGDWLKKMHRYATLLNSVAKARKALEDIYFSEELMGEARK